MLKKLLPTFLLSATLFADDAAPASSNMMQTIILIAIAAGFFYFILWRPEQKRRKAMQTQRESLKVGDTVTAMGIVGEVTEIKEETIVLKMIDGTSKIEFLKMAITDVNKPKS